MTTAWAWMKRSVLSAGCGLGALAFWGCSADVLEYRGDATGGAKGGSMSGVSGASPSAGAGTNTSAGVSAGGSSTSSAAGSGSAEGGSPEGGAPDASGGEPATTTGFPWPALPTERGTVVGEEAWDPSSSGCCSRVPGNGEPSPACPAGVETHQEKKSKASPDDVQSVTFGFSGDGYNHSIMLGGNYSSVVRVGAILTEIPPPEGIVDLSPVFWIGTESGELPPSAMVSITASNYGRSALHPGELSPGGTPVYYSEDGVEFTALDTYFVSFLGPTAFLEKPGFVVAGFGPDTMVCQSEE